ncbi:MAG: tRNA (adenosine(37)-N6)-threonylcarbamoyltransferase complex dimerization subunit type 1 TsaB [Nitrospirota bacterium]
MKVLAIDTSTMLGGVAIMDDFLGLIAEVRLNIKSTHSERLMTSIDHVLKQSGYMIADMDFFAVAIGPGSFTGLRIGLSTVKGFSYAAGKPVVSVPTLEALAWNFPFCQYPVCAMLDARKKEVYAALFKWKDDGFIRLIDEVSIKVDRLLERLAENNPPIPPLVKGSKGGFGRSFSHERLIFTGDGTILYRDKILELTGERAIFASPEKMVPSPANVAYIGIKKALRGEFSEPISLVPFYIRRSEAELKRIEGNLSAGSG